MMSRGAEDWGGHGPDCVYARDGYEPRRMPWELLSMERSSIWEGISHTQVIDEVIY